MDLPTPPIDQPRTSEELAVGILESITDAFFALDRDWRLTYVNRMAEQVLELPAGDLVGKALWEVFPGLVGSVFDEAYRKTAAERVPTSATAFYSDHQRWYEVHSYPAPDGMAIYFRDVTEGKLLAEESDRLRRVYETALSNTADFNYVFDRAGRFTYVNAALLGLWGKSLPEAVGCNFFDLEYPAELAARLQDQIQQVVRSRQPLRDETPYTSAIGTRAYEYIFVPVFGEDGSVVAVAGSTRDITDRKEAEQEIRASEERYRQVADELSAADRRKDEFLALLAHELRGPLAPLRSGLEIMRLVGGDNPRLSQAREIMERQLSHMVRLVDDLMDVSRIGNAKMELRRATIPVADVLASAVETSRPLIESGRQELTVSMPGQPILLDADLTRLAQVVANLLTNSAKYTPPGGTIRLTARLEGRQAVIEVEDTGIGIPAEALTTIFDMFSQVNRTVQHGVGGLGIGLALVKGIVELHGGTVSAQSEGTGRGSTFTVRLPVESFP